MSVEWDNSKPVGQRADGDARFNRDSAEAFRAKVQENHRQALSFGGFPGPRPILAALSGSTSPYSWTEVVPDGTTFHATPRAGTADAYEVNGVAGLGGKRVTLRPGRGDWRFQFSRAGEGPTECLATVCLDIPCAPSDSSGGMVEIKHDGEVVGLGTIPKVEIVSSRWSLTGCVEVDLAGIDLPATLDVRVTTSTADYVHESQVTIEACGETVHVASTNDNTGWLKITILSPNLRSCYTDYTGVTADWALEVSTDGGATWVSAGAGTWSFPPDDTYIPWTFGTGAVQYRITGTLYPPPGAADLLPSPISGEGSWSGGARNCNTITTLIGSAPTFGWAPGWSAPGGAQFFGGIPTEICWEGNANATLTRTGANTFWEGFEVYTATTRLGSFFCSPDSEADASVSVRIRAYFIGVDGCVGQWRIERRVPVCQVNSAGACFAVGGDADLNDPNYYFLSRSPTPGYVTTIGFSDPIPAWGVGDTVPDSDITFSSPLGYQGHAPHPPCHAPADGYTPGTIKVCGGGGFMAMAPAPSEPSPLDPDDPRRPENRKPFREIQKAAEATGCGRKIPADQRKGCGCSFECLKGHSPREDGDVTLLDCWRCPERPAISASTPD